MLTFHQKKTILIQKTQRKTKSKHISPIWVHNYIANHNYDNNQELSSSAKQPSTPFFFSYIVFTKYTDDWMHVDVVLSTGLKI